MINVTNYSCKKCGGNSMPKPRPMPRPKGR